MKPVHRILGLLLQSVLEVGQRPRVLAFGQRHRAQIVDGLGEVDVLGHRVLPLFLRLWQVAALVSHHPPIVAGPLGPVVLRAQIVENPLRLVPLLVGDIHIGQRPIGRQKRGVSTNDLFEVLFRLLLLAQLAVGESPHVVGVQISAVFEQSLVGVGLGLGPVIGVRRIPSQLQQILGIHRLGLSRPQDQQQRRKHHRQQQHAAQTRHSKAPWASS